MKAKVFPFRKERNKQTNQKQTKLNKTKMK